HRQPTVFSAVRHSQQTAGSVSAPRSSLLRAADSRGAPAVNKRRKPSPPPSTNGCIGARGTRPDRHQTVASVPRHRYPTGLSAGPPSQPTAGWVSPATRPTVNRLGNRAGAQTLHFRPPGVSEGSGNELSQGQ